MIDPEHIEKLHVVIQENMQKTAAKKCSGKEDPAGWCFGHEPYKNAWVKKTTRTSMLVTRVKAKGKNAKDSLDILAGEAGCKFEVGDQEGPLWGVDCPAPNADGTGSRIFWVYAGSLDDKAKSLIVWDFNCTSKKDETCTKDWNEIWDVSSNEAPGE